MCFHSNKRYIQAIGFLLLLLAYFPALASKDVSDSKAFNGVKDFRAIYDFKANKPKTFVFFLEVVGKTYSGIIDQGGHPEFVVAVRGSAIRFITSETWSFSEEDQQYLETSAKLIKDLTQRGVRFEACSIAADLFKVDHDTYLAEIHPVSNTFISLIGYQAQGFGLVPIN